VRHQRAAKAALIAKQQAEQAAQEERNGAEELKRARIEEERKNAEKLAQQEKGVCSRICGSFSRHFQFSRGFVLTV